MAKKSDMYSSVFADVDKMNEDGEILSEDTLSLVDEWIDTGSLALNAICSGSMYKGIPSGRITGIGGPSGCGKTLMMNKIIGNFQRKSTDRWGVIWDSEMACDAQTANALGADASRIKHYPIDQVSHMRNQILAFLNNVIANGAQGKFIIGIDSLGNLGGNKEVNDALENKDAADMGTRAKEIKSMLRVITYPAAKANVPIIFSNHIYSNPTAMFDTVIKQQSGGKGPQYLASLLIQMGVRATEHNEKDERDVMVVGARKYSGVALRAITAKNRFVPQYLETELQLNFKTGLEKYGGLFELAKEFGLFEGENSYSFNGEKLGFYKDWKYDEGIWQKILPVLEKKINEEWSFSQSSFEQMKQEVEK